MLTTSETTRAASVAGRFYPLEPEVLRYQVSQYLQSERPATSSNTTTETTSETKAPKRPKALIVPHAGYVFSGLTAGIAYQTLKHFSDSIRKVVLLGLSHRIPFRGIAAPKTHYFATPLGEVTLDRKTIDRLVKQNIISEYDDAHQLEHSLEVQLPFLQEMLSDFSLIPLATGQCSAEEVARCLEYLWGGDDTLILISSDLSHFHPYEEAQHIDHDTCDLILKKFSQLNGDQACGCRGINGLLHFIEERDYEVTLLDYRNSGDTAGDKDRVVGYGSFAVYPM